MSLFVLHKKWNCWASNAHLQGTLKPWMPYIIFTAPIVKKTTTNNIKLNGYYQ